MGDWVRGHVEEAMEHLAFFLLSGKSADKGTAEADRGLPPLTHALGFQWRVQVGVHAQGSFESMYGSN
jgi:hypothetical protein